MGRQKRYFWSNWPMASQQRFFRFVLVGTIVISVTLIIGMKLVGSSMGKQITEARDLYGRVAVIVEDVKSLRAQQGNLAHLDVREATWTIIDDLLIEENLTSLRSTKIDKETEGLQVTFKGLSLNKLMAFMQALRDQASLQTPKCILTRNPDDPRLADAHFILAR